MSFFAYLSCLTFLKLYGEYKRMKRRCRERERVLLLSGMFPQVTRNTVARLLLGKATAHTRPSHLELTWESASTPSHRQYIHVKTEIQLASKEEKKWYNLIGLDSLFQKTLIKKHSQEKNRSAKRCISRHSFHAVGWKFQILNQDADSQLFTFLVK
jgi:hypothetical protein